jgi:hypothetical protein
MATEVGIWDDSYEANADLSASNQLIGKIIAGRKVDIAGAGEGVGVIVSGTVAGAQTALRRLGKAKLKVNANSPNLVVGGAIKATTGGIGVSAASDKDHVICYADEAATTDGAIITVTLTGQTWIGV